MTPRDWPCIAALAARPGARRLRVAEAVAAGFYDGAQAAKDGYDAAAIHDAPLHPLLSGAAGDALAAARVAGRDLRLVCHSAIHSHGYEGLWQPAAAIQHDIGATEALAWSLSLGCNGMMLAVLQAGLMALDGPALVVGGDRFQGSSFDRWQSDRGLIYGDAVAAAVLAPDGFARITHADAVHLPALAALHGGLAPLAETGADPWDVTRTKRAYFQTHGSGAFFDHVAAALARLKARLDAALAAQGGSIAAVVTPFVGQSVARDTYEAAFSPYAPTATAVAYGLGIGHTGTCDPFLGLAHHLEQGRLHAGDQVLLIGAGAGFSVAALVIRLLREPQQTTTGVFQ